MPRFGGPALPPVPASGTPAAWSAAADAGLTPPQRPAGARRAPAVGAPPGLFTPSALIEFPRSLTLAGNARCPSMIVGGLRHRRGRAPPDGLSRCPAPKSQSLDTAHGRAAAAPGKE
jgi:hypothetical protein